MFSTFNTLMVIIVLEVICCLYSLALAYMSDKKVRKDFKWFNGSYLGNCSHLKRSWFLVFHF